MSYLFRIILFFVILVSSIINKCWAQDTRVIDSLKLALKNAKHDSALINAYQKLGMEIYLSQPDSAIKLWLIAKDIAAKNLNKMKPTNIEYKVFKKSLANAYIMIGTIYDDKGDVSKAIEYNIRGLTIQLEIGDKEGSSYTLNNIGWFYKSQDDLPKALEYYNKSLKIREEIGDKKGMAHSLNNIGTIYHIRRDISKAIECFEKGLSLQQEIGDKRGIASLLNNLGVIYKDQGDLSKSLVYYNKSLKIREEIDDKKGVALSLINIGYIYLKLKKYPMALQEAQRSMNVSRELGYPISIRNASKLLNQIYKATGNHKLALENYELYIKMRDSINNIETQKATIKQQLKYEYEKQAAADSVAHAKETDIKNAELAKQKAEISAKKNQQYALFGGLGLVIIFAGFMFNRFKVTQKQKVIIEHQKEIVEEQKHLVEEKQKEILDSIQYARRIQMAQIPSEKRVENTLKRLRK